MSTNSSYDYDVIVIGGGSGGLAMAKEAARLGARVALFDFVKPSTQGSTWGLGGTCVNVGCVPKKLMHYAGLMGAAIHHDATPYGWQISDAKHDWNQLVETVQNYIKRLNFGYRSGLSTEDFNVDYIRALAKFSSPNTVVYTLRGQEKTLSAANFLIAVGGRPFVPNDVPGAVEFAITSDDIFSLATAPGKTLVVGASYIALECAGFLHELGYDVSIAVRSILLRGFDRQCAEKIGAHMSDMGINFVHSLPVRIEGLENNQKRVVFADGTEAVYDTVLYATGRLADTRGLGLESAGVLTNAVGKIITSASEQTNVPNIYAIGDTAENRPELTPVAIRAGEMLARRLAGVSQELMDYQNIPTTVFTPVEYGCVGLSEEAAIEKYGADDIETYLFEFNSLEMSVADRHKHASRQKDEFDVYFAPMNLSKLVCVKSLNERVVGFHFVGPNAGEITQGFSLAVRLGARKSDFNQMIGIHPTDAESFVSLDTTRASGKSWVAAGGCGGGKCG